MNVGIRGRRAYALPKKILSLLNRAFAEFDYMIDFAEKLSTFGEGRKKYLFTTTGLACKPFCGLVNAGGRKEAQALAKSLCDEQNGKYCDLRVYRCFFAKA